MLLVDGVMKDSLKAQEKCITIYFLCCYVDHSFKIRDNKYLGTSIRLRLTPSPLMKLSFTADSEKLRIQGPNAGKFCSIL